MQPIFVSQKLSTTKPKKYFSRRFVKRSAVAVVLDNDNTSQASVLFIQRAKSERDPWSGHMAFPGGRYEKDDRNGLDTAKREMHEEIGFDADSLISVDDNTFKAGRVVGRLSDIGVGRRIISAQMFVSPYVFLVDRRPNLILNYEVADTVWIPLSYFTDLNNRSTMNVNFKNKNFDLPCYKYNEDQVIWGMTLKMLEELLGVAGFIMPTWKRMP